jgi:hypothetical protein
MAYRDARGQAMTDADWTAIEDQLLRAYNCSRGRGWQLNGRLSSASSPFGSD